MAFERNFKGVKGVRVAKGVIVNVIVPGRRQGVQGQGVRGVQKHARVELKKMSFEVYLYLLLFIF